MFIKVYNFLNIFFWDYRFFPKLIFLYNKSFERQAINKLKMVRKQTFKMYQKRPI